MENKKIGRPKKSPVAEVNIRKAISKTIEKYFLSGEFKEDVELGRNGKHRLMHMLTMLPYVCSKKESIKQALSGMTEEEMVTLVQRIREER